MLLRVDHDSPAATHVRAPARALRNPAGAVYGTVVAGAVIATESAAEVDLPRLTATVLATLTIYWLAHTYAELVDLRIRSARSPLAEELRAVLRDESAIVGASFVPLTVVLVGHLLGLGERAAVQVGLWSVVLLLAGWALLAGRRNRLRRLELAVHVLVSTLFGCTVVLLEVLLH